MGNREEKQQVGGVCLACPLASACLAWPGLALCMPCTLFVYKRTVHTPTHTHTFPCVCVCMAKDNTEQRSRKGVGTGCVGGSCTKQWRLSTPLVTSENIALHTSHLKHILIDINIATFWPSTIPADSSVN